jgi:hypothetical protein
MLSSWLGDPWVKQKSAALCGADNYLPCLVLLILCSLQLTFPFLVGALIVAFCKAA